MKIGIDVGHGLNTAGKRSPIGEREWSFNNKVALATIDRLNQYEDVQVIRLDDPTGATDVPLLTRTNKANAEKVALVVSIHHNAFQGTWGSHGGTEVITYMGSYPNAERLASIVLNRIVKEYALRNRGLKKANLHILRETNMDAILVEGGFMDSTTDIIKLRDDNVLRNVGIAIADGIAEYKGLKLKPVVAPTPTPTPPVTGDLYRVRKNWLDSKSQLGAYANLDSAISLAQKNVGYNVYDKDGVLVYPKPVPVEPELSQDELRRVRILIKDIK
jgi:N-acetylmuramoyl-L-alanine amidase